MNNDDIAFFIWHKAMVEKKINDPTFPRHSYDNGWESMDYKTFRMWDALLKIIQTFKKYIIKNGHR
jgi:hypothetical protein